MGRTLAACLLAMALFTTGCPSNTVEDDPGADVTGSGPDVSVEADAGGADVAAPDAASPEVAEPDGVDAGPAAGLSCAVVTSEGDRPTGDGEIVLGLADEPDAHLGTPGFQVDFRARLPKAAVGARAKLTVAGERVAERDVTVDPLTGEGAAVFTGVTLPHAPGGVTAVIAVSAGGEELDACAGTLRVDLGACPVALLPAPTGACLSDDEDGAPGFQRRFTVRSVGGGCDRASLEFQAGADPLQTAAVALDEAGEASFLLTLFPNTVSLNNESVSVTAIATDSANPGREGRSATAVYDIDTEPPVVTITTPAGPAVTTADDEDANPANGIQVVVRGTVRGVTPADGAALTLSVDGAELSETVVDATGAFAFSTVTLAQERDYTIKVAADDSCGAQGEASVTVRAETIAPTLDCAVLTEEGRRPTSAGPVMVRLSDEPAAYVDEPGLQVDVRALTTRVADGAVAALTLDGEPLAEATVAVDAATGEGEILFAGVTLPHAPDGLALAVSVTQDDALRASCEGTVTVDMGPCPVEVRPLAGACLRTDEDTAAGFQRRFTVRSLGGWCDRAALVWEASGEPVQTPSQPLDENGEAQFVVSLFPTTVALNNEAVLVVGIAGDSAAADREAQSEPRVYTVDTQPPSVTISAPADPVITLADDEDGVAGNGLQLVVQGVAAGVVPGDGSAVHLLVDGEVVAETVAAPSGAFAFPAHSFTESGTYAITVAAGDTCGGHGEATRVVRVETVVPSLAIVAPADGATLWARDDGDRSTPLMYEMDATIRAEDVSQGMKLTVRCRRDEAGAPWMDVAAYTVTQVAGDARYTVPIALRADLLGTAQVCEVTSDGDNPARSAEVAVTVALPAPEIDLLAPADELLTNADAVPVEGTARHLDGQPVELRLEDETGALVAAGMAAEPIADGAFAASFPFAVDGAPVADGRYRLVADATDRHGNRAAEQPESEAAAWITLDRTAPELTLDWPPAAGLHPDSDPAAADGAPDTPGYQTDVVVVVSGESAPQDGEVCLAKDGVDIACATPEAGPPSVVTFAAVTFQPGANALTVTARDAAGNEADPLTADIGLALDAPRVTITAPAAGTITLASVVDVDVDVADVGGIGGVDGADVTLTVGAAPTAIAAEGLGGGRYRFAGVPLAPGANAIRATAVAGGDEGVSDPITVTRKTAAPSLTFAVPPADAVLGRAAAACAPGGPDCVLDVSLAAADLEPASPVVLSVDCGAGAVEAEGAVIAGKATFPGVTLAHGGDCVLVATATDAVGQEATAGPITITVDRVAPVVAAIDLPDVLQWTADLAPDEPGMQITLAVTLDGVEAGQTVSVAATNDRGDALSYGVPLAAAVPEGASTVVELGVVTLPEAFVEVTVDVADAVGNPAETARRSLYVNSHEPDVRMLGPELVPADPCTTNADCAIGGACSAAGCARGWSATATFAARVGLTGIARGSDALRVCSDHGDLAAGTACATPGFFEVARVAVTGDEQVVPLDGALPEGFQVLIAEAEVMPGEGSWVASVDGAEAFFHRRPVLVDTTRPALLDLTAASDTEEPVGTLNIAEQAAPEGVYTLRAETSELGAVTFFVNGAEAATVPVEAGFATATVPLAEGTNAVQARVTDRVGNVSDMLPATPYAPLVDTIPPTLGFVYPDHSPVIAGDSLDVSLRSDAVGRDVTLFDDGVALGTAPVAPNGIVLFVHEGFAALADGSHTLTAEVRDPANNPASAASVPPTVLVDTTPPVVAIAAPAVGATFGDADDAAPGEGGFQTAVRFTPTGAETWRVLLSSGCDASYAACGAPVERAAGVGADIEEALVLTVPVADAVTHHVLSVEARDAHGNVVVETAPFTVELTACVVSVAGLPAAGVYNNALCAGEAGADCATVADTLTVSYALSCAGVDEVALYRDGTLWTSTTDVVNQGATLDVLLVHGDAFDLSARALSAGAPVGDSGAAPVRVDLRDPVPQFVAATVDGFITPASGDAVLYSLAHDQDPATTDAVDVHVRLTATDDGGLVDGAVRAIVRHTPSAAGVDEVALAPTNATLPRTIAAAPFSGDFKNLALPVGGHAVVATVADKAGNVATTSFDVTIDNVAPVVHAIDLPDVLLAAADVRPGDAGMQISLGVTLEGVEAGQEVAVRAENASGAVLSYAIALPTAAPDGAPSAVDLGIVTLPEGDVTVTVDVSDVAGNAAETGTATLYVTSQPPVVRLTQPARVPNDACSTSAECASGGVCSPAGCATSWSAASARSVRIAAEGVAPGADDIRVCSDHPDLAGGTPCATAGFHELARASFAGAPIDVPVADTLPEGFQVLVAEAESIAGGGDWVLSVDGPLTEQRRHVYVDTQAPAVAAVTLPGDTVAPTGVLNVAEQAAAGRQYRVRVTADEDGTATFHVNGAVAAAAPISGGVAEATVTLAEGANTLQATARDIVGNASPLAPTTPLAATVDTAPPTLAFVYPEHTPILAGQDLDVRLTSDAVGGTVSLYDGDPAALVATAPVAANGVALFPHTTVGALADGEHTLTAAVSDAAGNPTAAATSPATVVVDTTPPSVVVAAPASGATYTDADDADPATGGFQLPVGFTPTGAETWTLSLASGCDAGFGGCGAPVELDAGAAADVEVSRTITVPVVAATSYYVLTVDARDALGNVTQTDVPFTVELSSCVVTVEGIAAGGSYANALCAGTAGQDCDSVSDTLTVSFTLACVGADSVALYKDGAAFATTGAIDNQTASFAVSFAHGETFDLSARVLSGGATVGDSGATPVRVDLHDPTPLFAAADVGGFTTAATGAAVAYGIAADQQPGTATVAEIPVRLTATDDGALVGGRVVSIERVTGGTATALAPTNLSLPYTIAAAPLQVDLLNLPLPVGGPHTVRATVVDKVGNAAVTEFTATVDLTAPAIASVDLPDHLDWTDDLDPATAGMQVEVFVTLSGVEAGQDIDIVAAADGGELLAYAVPLATTVADAVPTQVSLGTLTLPEGDITVTADVADAAGNPADQASAGLYVNSDEPDVRMLLPTRVPNDVCTVDGDCASGGVCTASGCAAPWSAASTLSVRTGFLGVAPGADNLRICSDHPSLSGNAPCATAGYRAVAVADVTGDTVDVSLGGAIPEGFQILIAEAEPWAGDGGWVSSQDNASNLYQRRAVYVDTVTPQVTGITSPSDTEAPSGVLNIAEQEADGRQYAIRVAASEDGSAAIHVNGVAVATVAVTGGVAQATVTLAEGANSVQAVVTDLVGNASGLAPASPYAPTVDTVAPTLTFTAPDRSPLLAGDGLDVVLGSNAIGRTVTLSDGGVAVGTAPVGSGGTATFPHATYGTLSDGDHTLTAVVTDAAGNPRTAATSPATIQVDTVPPGLSVAAPTSGRVFTDDDDADAGAGGFQVSVRFTPSGASTWAVDLASGCDASHASCDAAVSQGTGAASGAEVTRIVTVPLATSTAYFRVGIEARDALGNVTRTEVPFTVELTNCVVSIAGVPASGVYNNALCPTSGSDCDTVADTLTVSYTTACVGTDTITLYKDGVAFASTSDIVDQAASFAVTFAHAETFDLSARTLSSGATVGDSGATPVQVDLHDPVPLFVAATVDGFQTAASGETVLYGIADDQQPASGGSVEIHLQLAATDDVSMVGGRVASLYRDGDTLAPSNVTLPYTFAASPFTIDLKNLSLPDGGPYTVRVAIADAANNTATTAIVAEADTVRPGAVALASITAADVNVRRPSITVNWAAVGDDGASGDAAASYDVRYSYAPIGDDAAFEAACDVAALVPGLPVPTPGSPGVAEQYTVDGPDARDPGTACRLVTAMAARPIYVAVKAVDAAGNASPLGVDSVKSTSDVHLRWATIAGDGANVATEVSNWVWPVGDVDADGYDDMAFADPWTNRVCVLYGHADDAAFTFGDYLFDAAARTDHVCVTSAAGAGVTTAERVDVNGDGVHDLVYGARLAFMGTNEVYVHLGVAGGRISGTPNVVIDGLSPFNFMGLWVENAGNFNGDTRLDGTPIQDLVISSDNELGPEGRATGAVYVVPGNESWDAATSLTIDVTDPTQRAAWDVARIVVQGTEDTGTAPQFGWRVAGVGDVLPDDGAVYDDIAVTQRIHDNAVYVIKGRPLVGAVDIAVTDLFSLPSPPVGEDAQVLRLVPEFGVAGANFGKRVVGGDLDGDGVPEIVVGHPKGADEGAAYSVYVFWGAETAASLGAAYTRVSALGPVEQVGDVHVGLRGVILPGDYQAPTLLGDFDDEGGTSTDLALRMKSDTAWGEIYVRLDLGLPAVSGDRGYLPFEDFVFAHPDGSGAVGFGNWMAGVGDVNGDGFPDILVGGDPTQGAPAAVLIY